MHSTFPPYDLEGQYDEKSSCWIRVSQGWAGIAWGAIAIPRIEQEVIVEFLEGDPDQPIVTGRTYHAYNVPPYALPAEKTKMSIKSKTHKGEGFNELRFEDEAGKEQVFIHAQMDKDIRVLNDAREWIGNERHLIVKKDQFEEVEANKHSNTIEDRFEQVEGDQHFTVKGDQNDKIDGSTSRNITMDLQQKVSMKYASDAGTEIHFKSSINQVIEAGASVTLKCGSNFININPAGVFIEGEMVMINSGGAAVSGTGSNPANAIAPMGVIEADDAKPGWEAKPPPPVVAVVVPEAPDDSGISITQKDTPPIILADASDHAAVMSDANKDVVDEPEVDCENKFSKISKVILKHEGGFVNDPDDLGGATNMGIAWPTWKKYAKQDLGVEPTLENLKALTAEQAEKIYYKRYWLPKGFCDVKNDRVGLMIYDWTITSGGAGKQIQKLLVDKYNANISTDGLIGNNTINAINKVPDQDKLLQDIAKKRKDYYRNLVKKRPANAKFLKGWLNRVDGSLKE